MLQIKPSKATLFCLVGIAVVLLLTCGFIYCNRASRLHNLKTKLDEKQQKLDDSKQVARRLSRVEQEYLDAQARLGTLEKGVSRKAYVPTLLRQLEDLGKSANLRVTGVRPRLNVEVNKNAQDTKGKPKKPEPYDKLDIDMEIAGKYHDVMSFLQRITSFPKIIAVRDLQINPKNDDKAGLTSPELAVRLSTTAFILKESDESTKQATKKEANVSGGRI